MGTETGNALRLLQEMVTNQRGLAINDHALLLVVDETGDVKDFRYETLSDLAAIIDGITAKENNPEDKQNEEK